MSIRPLSDRVVVEPAASSNSTPSGLALPESAQSKSQEGVVVAIGEGRWSEFQGKFLPSIIEVGCRVLFAKFAGTEIERDGKTYLLLNEREILAILDSGTAV